MAAFSAATLFLRPTSKCSTISGNITSPRKGITGKLGAVSKMFISSIYKTYF